MAEISSSLLGNVDTDFILNKITAKMDMDGGSDGRSSDKSDSNTERVMHIFWIMYILN